MAIPDYQTLMLPALRALADRTEHAPKELFERLAHDFALTPEERTAMLASGRLPVFNSRVHWAVTYLTHAGLIEKPRRAVWRITNAGSELLSTSPSRIDNKLLDRYSQFVEWRRLSAKPIGAPSASSADPVAQTTETPTETLERLTAELRNEVADELLAAIAANTWAFFERLVVRLLVQMGYGGTEAEAAAHVTGRPGDEGLDGLINEDRLGLGRIYIQAKRQPGAVFGRPAIQAFGGALDGAHARKGVYITTGRFSSDARDYVEKIEKRIALIDGPALAQLMVEYGVGVVNAQTFAIPRVDADFFDEG